MGLVARRLSSFVLLSCTLLVNTAVIHWFLSFFHQLFLILSLLLSFVMSGVIDWSLSLVSVVVIFFNFLCFLLSITHQGGAKNLLMETQTGTATTASQ